LASLGSFDGPVDATKLAIRQAKFRGDIMLEYQLDKEITFDLPLGKYRATLIDVKPIHKQTAKGKQNWIRLIFEVQIKGMQDLDCRAGRNFLLSFKAGSDLRNFLTPVLGEKFFKDNSAKTIDLHSVLRGLRGEVLLNHYHSDDFERPLVIVENFDPIHEGKD